MSDYTDAPPERHSFLSELELIANGYTQAVQTLEAKTVISTDAQGLVSGDIRLPTADGDIGAWFAAPAQGGPHPVILLVQEIFGLHEHIRDVARRLAKAGYLAVAPDLFARQGDPLQLRRMDQLGALAATVPDAQVLADLDAALAWARDHGGDADRAGVAGFCWGGRIAWLYAAHQPAIKAAAAWYGRLDGPRDANHPLFPLDILGRLHAPVLGLYGSEDEYIPLEHIEAAGRRLRELGAASTLQVFPEAAHGFYADYRASYRPEAARAAWRQMLDWFGRHGVARPDDTQDAAPLEPPEAD